LTLSNFDDARKRLPSAAFEAADGQPISSWGFRVLPYWGINNLNGYDAAWNATINRPVAAWAPEFFCMPGGKSEYETNVFAIAGPGTSFEGCNYPAVSMHALSDVPTDLILATEVADSKTHWMQPGDYDVTQLLAATGRLGDTVKGVLKDRIHILFADGEV
jgi:hypothetical protein